MFPSPPAQGAGDRPILRQPSLLWDEVQRGAVVSDQWRAERADITARLDLRKGVRRRESKDGAWLDHHCLFHPDTHRSASWLEEHGTYYCRTEDKTFPVPRVLEALSMRRQEFKHSRLKNLRQVPDKIPDHIYTYVFPD